MFELKKTEGKARRGMGVWAISSWGSSKLKSLVFIKNDLFLP